MPFALITSSKPELKEKQMSAIKSLLVQSSLSTRNHILNSLPEEDFARLLPDLKPVEMPLGKTIFHPEEEINYVYFLNTAMVSVVSRTADGQSVEAGVIGWEGIAGFNVLMGSDTMPNENIVSLPGDGHRLPTAAAKREFKRGGAFQDLCVRYMHAVIIQLGQVTLCNRLHAAEERLARWLIMCHDRAATDKLQLTQEFLSIMLGTNRVTVTNSAIVLQNIGNIKYKRGLITVLDREGLEDSACDCYRTIKQEYERFHKYAAKELSPTQNSDAAKSLKSGRVVVNDFPSVFKSAKN